MIEKKDFILNTINTALSDVFVDKRVRLDIEASNTTSSAGKINIKYDIVYYENDKLFVESTFIRSLRC